MKARFMSAALGVAFTLVSFGYGLFLASPTPSLAQSAHSQQESYNDIQEQLETQRQEYQKNEQLKLFRERHERFCKEIESRARLSMSARQFGKMTLEEALAEYVGPSYAYDEDQRRIHESIVWDAFSNPVALKDGSVPSHIMRDFSSKWVGLCERGELGWH